MTEITGGFWPVVVAIAIVLAAVPTLQAPDEKDPELDPDLGSTDLATGAGGSMA